jgi:hypothetical protein
MIHYILLVIATYFVLGIIVTIITLGNSVVQSGFKVDKSFWIIASFNVAFWPIILYYHIKLRIKSRKLNIKK